MPRHHHDKKRKHGETKCKHHGHHSEIANIATLSREELCTTLNGIVEQIRDNTMSVTFNSQDIPFDIPDNMHLYIAARHSDKEAGFTLKLSWSYPKQDQPAEKKEFEHPQDE